MPPATAAALPPDEPPELYPIFHGVLVGPKRRLSVIPLWPNSGVLVLPRTIAPASSSLSTAAALVLGTRSFTAREPMEVGTPATSSRSLIATGTPCRGPRGRPDMTAASAAC